MFHIVLFQPEIPPNTGNVIRLCANTGCRLHLIRPLGFGLEDSRLKRAGLDYHEYATVKVHAEFGAFLATVPGARTFAFTTRATKRFDRVEFKPGDVLVFGPETRGLPQEVLTTFEPERQVRLPMLPTSRSLNLSNAVAVVVYEGLRQNDFKGMS